MTTDVIPFNEQHLSAASLDGMSEIKSEDMIPELEALTPSSLASPHDSSIDKEELCFRVEDFKFNIKAPLGTECTEEARRTFVSLHDNEYRGDAKGLARGMTEEWPCECKYSPGIDEPSSACGENSGCINRELYVECTECPTGASCQNRRFQHHDYAQVEVFNAGPKGFGLRTLQDLPSGTFVREYVGEVISAAAFGRRTRQYDNEKQKHFYFMSLTPYEVIDATKRGSLARFINHSCSPNATTHKWIVNGRFRIGIFTTKFIARGEELTFDYQFQRYGHEAQKCFCGSSNCRGYIGGEATGPAPDYEGLDSDEDDDDDNGKKSKKPKEPKIVKGIDSHADVVKLIRVLTRNSEKPARIRGLLARLEATTLVPIWRDVLKFRAMTQLKLLLVDYGRSHLALTCQVLRILKLVPIITRNTSSLVDSKIDEVVEQMSNEHLDLEIRELAKQVFDKWSELEIRYKIPKRKLSQMDISLPSPDATHSTGSSDSPKKSKKAEQRSESPPIRRRMDSYRPDYSAPPKAVTRSDDSQTGMQSDGDAEQVAEAVALFSNASSPRTPMSPYINSHSEEHLLLPNPDAYRPLPAVQELVDSTMTDSQTSILRPPSTSVVAFAGGLTEEDLRRLIEDANEPPDESHGKHRDHEGRHQRQHRKHRGERLRTDDKHAMQGHSHRRKRVDRVDRPTAQQDPMDTREPGEAQSSNPGAVWSDEQRKQMRDKLAPVVAKILSQWKSEMGKDQFKHLARKITHSLVEKEAKERDPPVAITHEIEAKANKYIKVRLIV
ncbi:SET domain-containing protein [Gonapodya prolifera JEL478]|uniref:[histone H3]-lysine(36) N-trimethyltransferase n=1 Tax=Gonapodya prolifera (strain JEL478) TaxID=1344416 RepID=A0A139A2I6_GONPJ|nr:SET domain-containing protein [Gonapodya prolifera JEL478]|eukprot:KXS11000.1 SET domain-containing protein [Gonapodya prolifera JEL478]